MRNLARKMLTLGAAVLLGTGLAACDNSAGPDPVGVPTDVTATATSATSVRVGWSQVAGATGYRVERAESNGAFAQIASDLTSTFYDDVNLTAGTSYSYRVSALNGTTQSEPSTAVAVTTPAAGPKQRTLTGFISSNTTLRSDTTYVLSGYVKVTNAATLTIEPGTRIVGDTTVAGSSLWVLRGSKIRAMGTADKPIVFTSQRAPGTRKPGDWGGLIIIGNAPINRMANPIYTEGPVGAAENYAGGTDFNDSSGSLRYVRIEFAGYDVSNGAGQELNGVSSYAVGRGTTYEYVQVLGGLDDSFEFWGGGVDVRYLVSYESGDDHFDWTEGYRGRGQFLIGLQTTVLNPRPGTGTLSSDPRGIESDGCENDKAGCTYANAPYTSPVWANFTLIGPGAGVFSRTDGNGVVLRRGSAGTLVNSVVGRWPGVGISIRDAESAALLNADTLTARNLVLSDNGSNFEPAGTNFGAALADGTRGIREVSGVTGLFLSLPAAGVAPTLATLDWRPVAGGALSSGGLSSFAGTRIAGRTSNFFGAEMPATAYVGAADPNGPKWWEGWTSYARN